MRTRLVGVSRTRTLRRRGVEVGRDVTFYGAPIVTLSSQGSVTIGDRVVLCSDSRHTSLGVSRPVILRTHGDATISIGPDSGLSGTAIIATRAITIGARCLLGADVMIGDTDFHPVDLPTSQLHLRRYAAIPYGDEEDAIVVADDVFIGARAILLKGTRIGPGSVIGAGSVVSGEIPAGVIAAGAPARVLRALRE